MDRQLASKGWSLSEEGLEACVKATKKDDPSVSEVINVALRSDLRQIAVKQLPDNVTSGQVESVSGPVVLQVQKIRNISAPLANQDSKGAPRMLKLNMTDGVNHCVAIEFDSISFLTPDLIPGTKVCLLGTNVAVVKGCILLTRDNIKVLGGEVEVLKTKWEASKQFEAVKRFGKIKDDPPPEFREFDGTRKPRSAQRKHNTAPETTTTKTDNSSSSKPNSNNPNNNHNSNNNNKNNSNNSNNNKNNNKNINNNSRTAPDDTNRKSNTREHGDKTEQRPAPSADQKKPEATVTKEVNERRENNKINNNNSSNNNSNSNNSNNNNNNNKSNNNNNNNNNNKIKDDKTAASKSVTSSSTKDDIKPNIKDNKDAPIKDTKGKPNERNKNEHTEEKVRGDKQKANRNIEKTEQSRNTDKNSQNRNSDRKDFADEKRDQKQDQRKGATQDGGGKKPNQNDGRKFDKNERGGNTDRGDYKQNDRSKNSDRKDTGRWADDDGYDRGSNDRKNSRQGNNRSEYDMGYDENPRDQPSRNKDSGFHDRLRQLADYEQDNRKSRNRTPNDQYKKDIPGGARNDKTKANPPPSGDGKKESGGFKYDNEYDRKMETKKTEKDLWRGGNVDGEEYSDDKRGGRDNRSNGRGGGRGGARNNYHNDRNDDTERRMTAKERRQASGEADWSNDRGNIEWSSNRNKGGGKPDSRNYQDSGRPNDRRGDSSQGSSRASSASRGNGRAHYDGDSNYDSGKGRNDRRRNDRDNYDRDYDRNYKGGKPKEDYSEGRRNQHGGGRSNEKEDDRNPVPYNAAQDRSPGKDVQKKPVAYDATNQSWYYDGEEKPLRENAATNDSLTVTFKNDAAGSLDGATKKGGRDNDRNQRVNEANKDRNGNQNQGRRYNENRNERFDDRRRDNSDKNNRESYQGRKDDQQKPAGRGGHNRQNDYNHRDDGRSNRDDFKSQRKYSNDSRSSRGSRDSAPHRAGQRTDDRNQRKKDITKQGDINDSQTSPGRRIPLEVLFGRSPSGSVDNELDAIDNISTSVSNLSIANDPSSVTHPPPGMHLAGHPYPKMTSKEIMERSLEQDPFGSGTHPDLLYMQQVTQLQQQQQQMNFYQQQLAAAGPYIGFPTEHAGVGAAAATPGINPYLAYGNTVEDFRYNQLPLHQLQQQQVGGAGGQNLAAGGAPAAYYYPVSNPTTQPLPPAPPAQLLEQYQ